MKERIALFISLLFVAAIGLQAQNTSSIGSSVGVFVFPAQGQDQAQQDADEFACFNWAKQQTGYDPMNPTQVQAAEVDRSADGSAVRGAARGAAAGAAIGAIAGDTGKGAAIGAAAGGIRGRRAKVYGDEMQQQQNYENAAATEASMLDEYKRAFGACMEAKGYTVK